MAAAVSPLPGYGQVDALALMDVDRLPLPLEWGRN
jgi:hypothetical protein